MVKWVIGWGWPFEDGRWEQYKDTIHGGAVLYFSNTFCSFGLPDFRCFRLNSLHMLENHPKSGSWSNRQSMYRDVIFTILTFQNLHSLTLIFRPRPYPIPFNSEIVSQREPIPISLSSLCTRRVTVWSWTTKLDIWPIMTISSVSRMNGYDLMDSLRPKTPSRIPSKSIIPMMTHFRVPMSLCFVAISRAPWLMKPLWIHSLRCSMTRKMFALWSISKIWTLWAAMDCAHRVLPHHQPMHRLLIPLLSHLIIHLFPQLIRLVLRPQFRRHLLLWNQLLIRVNHRPLLPRSLPPIHRRGFRPQCMTTILTLRVIICSLD